MEKKNREGWRASAREMGEEKKFESDGDERKRGDHVRDTLSGKVSPHLLPAFHPSIRHPSSSVPSSIASFFSSFHHRIIG